MTSIIGAAVMKPYAVPSGPIEAGREGGPSLQDVLADPNHSDIWNAKLFVAQHGNDVRYCHDRRRWYLWKETYFEADNSGEVERLAATTIESIHEFASREPDDKHRAALRAHALRSASAPKVRSMLEVARSDIRVSVTSDQFDRDPWLLACENGTIDLKSGGRRDSLRDDLITRHIPVRFDPEAVSPLWDAFLLRIMDGSEDLIRYLRRAIGYSLTGRTSEQVFFLLWGRGANGKSTFVGTVETLLGDYAARTPVSTFLAKRGDSIPNDVARLAGVRFISAVEAQEGRGLSELVVKQMTGGDSIAARFLHHEYFEFRAQGKIFLAVNHKPIIRGTDEAIWRRVRLIPFSVTIPEPDRDGDLSEKLRAELPGILNWAVAGCLEWQATGLGTPQAVKQATAEYRSEQDVVGEFLEEHSFADAQAVSALGDIHAKYADWCQKRKEHPISSRKLSASLIEKGYHKTTSGGVVRFQGIGIR